MSVFYSQFQFINSFVHKRIMGMGGYTGTGFAHTGAFLICTLIQNKAKGILKKGYMEQIVSSQYCKFYSYCTAEFISFEPKKDKKELNS